MLLSFLLEDITEYSICVDEGLTLECCVPVNALHVFADFPIVPFGEVYPWLGCHGFLCVHRVEHR